MGKFQDEKKIRRARTGFGDSSAAYGSPPFFAEAKSGSFQPTRLEETLVI
jgi:hypothetical protein